MFVKYLQHVKWEIFLYKSKENERLKKENFLPKNFFVGKFNIILLVGFLRNLCGKSLYTGISYPGNTPCERWLFLYAGIRKK
jgi:hypothetical protein